MPRLNTPQNDNTRTLQSYQDKTEQYIAGTPPVDDVLKTWIDECLNQIPKDGKILEVGSGFGRDAEYIMQKGFSVACSDAVPNFVELLKGKGFRARLLNLLTDNLPSGYDMVFADAVLLHFTPEEAARATQKIYTALNSGGIFALRVKKGNGAAWTNEKLGEPRYFYYWQPEDLKKMLTASGFAKLDMSEGYSNHTDWIGAIAQKV